MKINLDSMCKEMNQKKFKIQRTVNIALVHGWDVEYAEEMSQRQGRNLFVKNQVYHRKQFEGNAEPQRDI